MKNNSKSRKRKGVRGGAVAAATDGQVDEAVTKEREAKAEEVRSKPKGIKGPNPNEGRCADCHKVRRVYHSGIEGDTKRRCAKCVRRELARQHKVEQKRVERVAQQLGVVAS